MKPEFITFTGADDIADLRSMEELSAQFPIEWGLLFSASRVGTPRYPTADAMLAFTGSPALKLSAHICGSFSREIVGGSPSTGLVAELVDGARFDRAQINIGSVNLEERSRARVWCGRRDMRAIFQTRDRFPEQSDGLDWLYDASGGKGILPSTWPEAPDWAARLHLAGYAGGLNPANVAEMVERIGRVADRYWIDMESGVRNERDEFDLGRCRQVCEAVYGETQA